MMLGYGQAQAAVQPSTYVRFMLSIGYTDQKTVRENIRHYENALQDFKKICANPKIRPVFKRAKLNQILQYAEKVLQIQLPYGLDALAGDFHASIAEARKFVQLNQCSSFTGDQYWQSELNALKAEVER